MEVMALTHLSAYVRRRYFASLRGATALGTTERMVGKVGEKREADDGSHQPLGLPRGVSRG
jgi:hypothetical protein